MKPTVNEYLNHLKELNERLPSRTQLPIPKNSVYGENVQQQLWEKQLQQEEEYYYHNGDGGGGNNSSEEITEYVFVDPLPLVSNDDAYIRMNGWCSGGSGVGGNSERVLRPNHPDFSTEVMVNGRLAYYTEIGGEKIIYNNTLNRWELLAMWYGNGDLNNPLLGVGTGSNIPYPFYATWTTYIDPVYNAIIQSIEKVAVGTTKATDPGPPCA